MWLKWELVSYHIDQKLKAEVIWNDRNDLGASRPHWRKKQIKVYCTPPPPPPICHLLSIHGVLGTKSNPFPHGKQKREYKNNKGVIHQGVHENTWVYGTPELAFAITSSLLQGYFHTQTMNGRCYLSKCHFPYCIHHGLWCLISWSICVLLLRDNYQPPPPIVHTCILSGCVSD